MRKIPTLFIRDFTHDNGRYVTDEVTPGCEWVLAGEGVATRKYDGTCLMFDGSAWWARREVKPDKNQPTGFVEVGRDGTTGKVVGWEPIEQSSFAKFHAEIIDHEAEVRLSYPTGTYELIGPKINGNPERMERHELRLHAQAERITVDNRFAVPARIRETVLRLNNENGWEGIVWHHTDGRMAKIKARDFRKRP